MNGFLRSHRVVSVAKELAKLPEGMVWCFCVEYLLDGENRGGKSSPERKSERIDYKEVLSESDFALFAKLRETRKSISQSENIPVYTVCTNEHLAQMAQRRFKTPEELKEIHGFGEAKCSKYGAEFLKVISDFKPPEPVSP